MLVGNPATRRTAVVEIKHRGYGVDAQAIDPIAVEPEQTAGEQEVGDFGAPVIVDESIPVEMPALLGLGVLVDRGPVKAAKAVRIVGEMSRHPIQQHAQAGAMA